MQSEASYLSLSLDFRANPKLRKTKQHKQNKTKRRNNVIIRGHSGYDVGGLWLYIECSTYKPYIVSRALDIINRVKPR